ncbi:MAG: NUDIX domain-containing protein [Chitinispirillales bacterium]|jgi:8-oxo-dGTP pyrophosphatase MutT (NUDIX family)|nr:NUDIX domain-containing protein [Chitinispirillales bacterium]
MDDSNTPPVIEQAGAVMYRRETGEIQILTVRAKRDPSVRIFPKGHIEDGENDIEASARECFEEAGMSGIVIGFCGERKFTYEGKLYRVRYHVIRYESTEHDGEPGREPQWNSVSKTRELLPFPGLKEILDKSFEMIKSKENHK